MSVLSTAQGSTHLRARLPRAACIPAHSAHRVLRDRLVMARLLYVAAETGARFVRERINVEPLDWLFSEREVFGGGTAVSSCAAAEGFRRAAVLHGLSFGLDAAPRVLEGIPASEFLSSRAFHHVSCGLPMPFDTEFSGHQGPLALYTCSIISEVQDECVQIFCGMIARSEGEVRGRLRQRYGPMLEDEAQVRLGFDWSEPLAGTLVSEAMAHVLAVAAADPTSSFASGFDFQVEQRFAS